MLNACLTAGHRGEGTSTAQRWELRCPAPGSGAKEQMAWDEKRTGGVPGAAGIRYNLRRMRQGAPARSILWSGHICIPVAYLVLSLSGK